MASRVGQTLDGAVIGADDNRLFEADPPRHAQAHRYFLQDYVTRFKV